jgi:hypothetical protein
LHYGPANELRHKPHLAGRLPYIEICGITRTLLADETAVDDPRDPNDRLLLGVKGTIS